MYIVLSLDASDTYSVCIHSFTNDINKSKAVYDILLKEQKDDEFGELIEMIEIDEDFNGPYCFFWGEKVPGVTIIRSNNRD